jgi:hypothetical protein
MRRSKPLDGVERRVGILSGESIHHADLVGGSEPGEDDVGDVGEGVGRTRGVADGGMQIWTMDVSPMKTMLAKRRCPLPTPGSPCRLGHGVWKGLILEGAGAIVHTGNQA